MLKAWGRGDGAALDRLVERVYPELRLMARRYMKNEAQGYTLQATALVHEVYLRLVDVTNVEWQEHAQFFAIAAQMMRRILVDAARTRGSRMETLVQQRKENLHKEHMSLTCLPWGPNYATSGRMTKIVQTPGGL